MFDSIRPSKVIILASAPLCGHRTRDPSLCYKTDFVRMLHTSAWKESTEKTVAFLETANITRGVAAAGKMQIRIDLVWV